MTPQDLQTLTEEFLTHGGFLYEKVATIGSLDGDSHPTVMVTVVNSDELIGPNGETLQAVSYLLKKIAEQKFGEEGRHFLFDVNGHQTKKIEDLKSKVKMLAERVRSLKSEVELSPMNSYERMVVHALFTDDADVATESRGEGRERRIYMIPRKKGIYSDNGVTV